MSLTDRDRKVLAILLPLVLLAVYWFAVLGPKLDAGAALGDPLSSAREERDEARGRLGELLAAREQYDRNYAQALRLTKAVPSAVDVPGLVLELERAASAAGLEFLEVTPGTGTPADRAKPARPASGASAIPQCSGQLQPVPLGLTFRGDFFDVADLFRRLDRVVGVVNEQLQARGRLITIDGFDFDTGNPRRIKATVNATAYIAPDGDATIAEGEQP